MKSFLHVTCALLAIALVTASFPGATPSVSAAPSASPFAGSYRGTVPGTIFQDWVLTVAPSGKVAGAGSGIYGGFCYGIAWTGELSGWLRADGSLSVSGREVLERPAVDSDSCYSPGGTWKENFKGTATLTRNEDGTLGGGLWTAPDESTISIVWYPQ